MGQGSFFDSCDGGKRFPVLRCIPSRAAFRAASALIGSLLVACGGGGGSGGAASDPVPQIELEVRLAAVGSVVDCRSDRPTTVLLERSDRPSREIDCPSVTVIEKDFEPSVWRATPLLANVPNGEHPGRVETATVLPPPIVLQDGDDDHVLVLDGVDLAQSHGATLEHVSGFTDSAGSPEAQQRTWRWSVESDGVGFESGNSGAIRFIGTDTGAWGSMTLVPGAAADAAAFLSVEDYGDLGLPQLTEDRTFRDVRYADFNNDGLFDVVSNVYGSGCALIGLALADGTFDVRTPLRDDGSCIGGYGETILVADFDGDGWIDIFLPSYQRFDFLKNLGGGEFVEIADRLGISFPDYLPKVEGAAAVDLDFDGDVDIVVASEVLLNDGAGGFERVNQPFGVPLFDEGMSVADLDSDGIYDIVKSHPSYGPRIYWGVSEREFEDAGWLFGGVVAAANANGVAVGDVTGNGLGDLVLAGGAAPPEAVPADANIDAQVPSGGAGPRLCAQVHTRRFHCLSRFVPPIENAWSDLVMVTDVDEDGRDEVVARYGTIQVYRAEGVEEDRVFRIDLRDANGRGTMYGHSLIARCSVDGSLVGVKNVDGGNGYMAQGQYVVSFRSRWCPSITVAMGAGDGVRLLGTFGPGLSVVRGS